MSEHHLNVNPKTERIYIFKLGTLWYFKYFFDDQEIFKDLSRYYNRERFRFELKTVEEREHIMNYLEEKGFEPVPIIDACEYGRK